MAVYYDVAQICLNGHLINADVKSNPQFNKNFCDNCGAQSIIDCANCQSPIPGRYHGGGIYDGIGSYHVPAYCADCGAPYPWTAAAQEAAYALIEFSTILNEADKGDLKESVSNIIEGGPKTSLAVLKFKSYASKAGKEVASGLKEVLVEVVSETVKKAIWG